MGKSRSLPPQREQLAEAQAGHCCGEVERRVPQIVGSADKGRQLLADGKRLELAAVAHARPIDQVRTRGVLRKPVLPHRMLEDTMRDRQVTDHCARCAAEADEVVSEALRRLPS